MEYLHDLVWFHDLFKAVNEWIYCLQINYEAFVCEINLNQLHLPVLCQAFAINTQDWCMLSFQSIHNGIRQLLNLPGLRYYVIRIGNLWKALLILIELQFCMLLLGALIVLVRTNLILLMLSMLRHLLLLGLLVLFIHSTFVRWSSSLIIVVGGGWRLLVFIYVGIDCFCITWLLVHTVLLRIHLHYRHMLRLTRSELLLLLHVLQVLLLLLLAHLIVILVHLLTKQLLIGLWTRIFATVFYLTGFRRDILISSQIILIIR